MKKLLYPFAFVASWCLWLYGDISCRIMLWLDGPEGPKHQTLFELWFQKYQTSMKASSDVQDYVEGEGRFWPWGAVYDPVDDK